MKNFLFYAGTIILSLLVIAVFITFVIAVKIEPANVFDYYGRAFEIIGEEGLFDGISTVWQLAKPKLF
ncbi:MAG: hypothetical protein J6R83_00735 [Clostridia bacterium]|nr:hypothetical protein [Clostridia bacterium]